MVNVAEMIVEVHFMMRVEYIMCVFRLTNMRNGYGTMKFDHLARIQMKDLRLNEIAINYTQRSTHSWIVQIICILLRTMRSNASIFNTQYFVCAHNLELHLHCELCSIVYQCWMIRNIRNRVIHMPKIRWMQWYPERTAYFVHRTCRYDMNAVFMTCSKVLHSYTNAE